MYIPSVQELLEVATEEYSELQIKQQTTSLEVGMHIPLVQGLLEVATEEYSELQIKQQTASLEVGMHIPSVQGLLELANVLHAERFYCFFYCFFYYARPFSISLNLERTIQCKFKLFLTITTPTLDFC